MKLASQQRSTFCTEVWRYYRAHGRHELPWRQTQDPYRILVSEVMLQQTQVVRVLPKYREFLQHFPNTKALATAPLGDVLRAWQGLGYNRRAKYLKEAATTVHEVHHGRWPRSAAALQTLPGIGPYTAGAVAAFAYNEAVPIIETNIRTVYLHHFFPDAVAVSEMEILSLVKDTLDHDNPREWYWALMDYGAHLKQQHGNPNRRARAYVAQSRFAGSDRQIRGRIIAHLRHASATATALAKIIAAEPVRIKRILMALVAEGLVVQVGRRYQLP
jgi:A/G-specific adenine glycosylase